MTTIKSYTDISQSKKLAEILPIESADMYYFTIIRNYPYSQGKIKAITKIMDGSFSSDYDIPCWSLAALLDVLPDGTDIIKDKTDTENEKYMCTVGTKKGIISTFGNNPVDACYEMILKLKELKML